MHAKLRLLGILLYEILHFTLCSASIFSSKIQWSLSFSNANNSVTILQPNTTYQLILQLTRAYTNQSEILCPECSSHLWDAGGYPLFNTGISPNLSETYSMRDYFDNSTLTWTKKYTTAIEVGIITFNIDTSPFLDGFDHFVKQCSVSFSITNVLSQDGKSMLLGTIVSSTAPTISSIGTVFNSYFSVLNATHFLYTPDHWKTSMVVMHNFTANPVPGNVCGISSGSSFEILSLLYLHRFLLVATNRGLYKVNTQSGEITYLLSQCIVGMKTLSYPLGCYKGALVYSSTGMWRVDSSGSLFEVLDKKNLTLQRFFPNAYRILSADITSQNCSEFATLVLSSDRYYIVNFHQCAWEVSFVYPRTVPQFSPFQPLSLHNGTLDLTPAAVGITNYSSVPLVLTDIQYARHPSSHLIIYGSCLFLSPNDGLAQYLVSSPASTEAEYINSVTSSVKNAYYYFSSASGNVYYGSLFESTTQLLTHLSTPPVFLEFDFDDSIYSLASSLPNLPVRQDLNLEALTSQALLLQRDPTMDCYLESVNLVGPTDPMYTRLKSLSKDIPDAIFLDYGAVYQFQLEVKPYLGTPFSKVQASFVLSHNDWLNITTVRVEDYQLNLVKFIVTIQDAGNFNEQQYPDAVKSSTSLFILLQDAMLCLGYPPRSIIVYSGCPPFQKIEMGKPKKTMCVDPNPKYPCQYADEDYLPSFYLLDNVTNEKVKFKLSYTLQVIGGGVSPTSLSYFPEDKISLINSQTWGPSDDLPQLPDGRYVLNSSKNTLFFICSGESPCAKVFPKFPEPAQYYFITLMSNKGLSENRTYCEHDFVYVFRLHGLNVDFTTASLITFFTFALTLALVLGIAFTQFIKSKREMLKVGITDVHFKPSSHISKSTLNKTPVSTEKLGESKSIKGSRKELSQVPSTSKSILKTHPMNSEDK